MPLTVDELRSLADELMSHGWGGPPAPPAVDIVDVLAHLDSDDRNVRVAALRVLSFSDDPRAADGILKGLDDPKRRVRDVAAKSSPRHLSDPRVVARLQQLVEEGDRAASGAAMYVLGGMYTSPYGLSTIEPVATSLAALIEQPRARQTALLALLRARTLTDDLRGLLQSIVRDGDKQEAIYATRRLDGYRVAHDGELVGNTEARRNVDRAFGDVWYWIRVPEER